MDLAPAKGARHRPACPAGILALVETINAGLDRCGTDTVVLCVLAPGLPAAVFVFPAV